MFQKRTVWVDEKLFRAWMIAEYIRWLNDGADGQAEFLLGLWDSEMPEIRRAMILAGKPVLVDGILTAWCNYFTAILAGMFKSKDVKKIILNW